MKHDHDAVVTFEGNAFVITASLSGNRVVEAWSTGRMVHDMNSLLGAVADGSGPRFTTRAACLCNAGHALAATRAVEDLLGAHVPPAARLVRDLAQALGWISEHLGHFYLFHLTDWTNPGRALRADPAMTARLAARDRPCPDAGGRAFYAEAAARLSALTAGEAGEIFGIADWDHPAHTASPEHHLLLASHVPGAMETRARLAEALAALRCTGPDHPAFQIGGLAESAGTAPGASPDLSGPARTVCAALLAACRDFILDTFLPDALCAAAASRDWADIGKTGTYLAWGDLPGKDGDPPFFPGGVFTLGGGIRTNLVSPDLVFEDNAPAWTATDADRYRLRLGPGQPRYQWKNDDFTWFGVPRHAGLACEVGPLARVLGACATGNDAVKGLVDSALHRLNLPLAALDSTLGRMLARAIEAAALIQAALSWLDSLDVLLAEGPVPLRADIRNLPASGEGVGLAEIARGALVHRIRMEKRRIIRHDSLVPSLWNFSPRGADGVRGPLEQALLGTPVADPGRPLEILRTVHAFDPCNACLLRVEDGDASRVVAVAAK
ncbi:nickel-dependent hydrogenase large subunit [Desulfolutivibrio sulfoxidireducens]|uniref:nickel-dependent hydrogenase large subunit n=1 Tax=Desulfolutivibrio sulfoxidireducens TaxID=2773299 RepID=UPI00159E8B2E|nr:nickel-dependent hydrogenase large subunit [Desulfolutivibrio sulfoxidireducens]